MSDTVDSAKPQWPSAWWVLAPALKSEFQVLYNILGQR
jgi:hypothetical protein